MTIQYDTVVPWGRSFDEYRRMFQLTDAELHLGIVGCGDGPANFNHQMLRRGHLVISCDPLYQLSATQIQERITATYENVIEQTRENLEKYVWTDVKSVDELGQIRLAAMNDFLTDYDCGRKEGRYIASELPYLPFGHATFDIALCSHYLFLYSDNLSLDFHQQAIEEMCRVASEARVFPLLTYNAEPSPHIEPLIERLTKAGYKINIEKVHYEFQRQGNKLLKVSR